MAISDGNPLTGASNAGGADRNRDFEPINQSINQFNIWLQCLLLTL